MADPIRETTDDRERVAEAYGKDGHRHGVSIEGCRSYADDPRIQQAWRRGWMEEESQDRKRRGQPGVEWMRYVR